MLRQAIDKIGPAGNRYGRGRVGTPHVRTTIAPSHEHKGELPMKKLSFAIVGAAALALAACGGKGDDALADNVEDNYEAAADNLEAMADNATGAEAAALENQADALEVEGDAKADAIDSADVNAVNAM